MNERERLAETVGGGGVMATHEGDTLRQQALDWLNKQLKQKRIALYNAERKPNADGEIADINKAIDGIEWIIGVVSERGAQ